MSSSKKLFLLLISLSLIICQETNKTEEPKETNKESIESNETHTEFDPTNDGKNNTHARRQQRRDFKSKIPFNMTIDEMDTMIFCTAIVQESIKKQKEKIEALLKKFNISNSNPIYEKVGTDIFENCNKNLDIKLVNIYMKNLTFFGNFKWREEFDELSKVDYDKYNNLTDLRLTTEQQILMYKYQRVDELFRQKRADEREYIDNENKKIRIGQIDMDSIPSSIKFLVFLVILVLLFGGVFYFLKTLEKKPKDKKKKEKKKKTQ